MTIAGRWVTVAAAAVAVSGFAPRPRFRLAAVGPVSVATGYVALAPAQSPFALAVTKDGRITFDLDITVHNLPAPSTLGPYTSYQAWLATPNLDVVRHLGAVSNDSAFRARADWNKFTVVISAEPAVTGQHWRGAIVLVGRSPSSLMQSFAGHPFYNTGMPPE
jgi:hypothetical protein